MCRALVNDVHLHLPPFPSHSLYRNYHTVQPQPRLPSSPPTPTNTPSSLSPRPLDSRRALSTQCSTSTSNLCAGKPSGEQRSRTRILLHPTTKTDVHVKAFCQLTTRLLPTDHCTLPAPPTTSTRVLTCLAPPQLPSAHTASPKVPAAERVRAQSMHQSRVGGN